MNNSINEIKFMERIKNANQINYINGNSIDLEKIIRNLNYLEEQDRIGGLDFTYNEYFLRSFQ